MNQQKMKEHKAQKINKQPNCAQSKQKSIERKLDKELEMTFPASDPLASVQPKPDKKSTSETISKRAQPAT